MLLDKLNVKRNLNLEGLAKQMTKKVVHIVYSFGCGGLEKVIANLINHSTQYDVEHLVVSLIDDVSMQYQLDFPIKIIVLNKRSGNDLISHKKLYVLLKKLKPQVINTYNFGTIEYHFTAKMAGVPVRVHSDHGRGGDDPQGKDWLHNIFRKIIAQFITEYVVVSNDLFTWITKTLNIKKCPTSLIHNGVVVKNQVPLKNAPLNTFVTVGRLDNVKNQKLLINAFAQAVNTGADFDGCILHIVGDGPLHEALNGQIHNLNMQNSIKLLGFRSDIEDILSDSDVFVLSSVYEAMPMTILEAMANKTPVICTNVGGISKFITEQEAWFVASNNVDELSEKLITIRTATAARKQKVDKAYLLTKDNYSVDNMVKEYMNKYQIQMKKVSR